MAEKPIQTPLPADLPTDWVMDQIVSPGGTEVGLTQQHGYNYLNAAVNAAQQAINTINDAFPDISTSMPITTATLTASGWAQQSDETYRQAVSSVTVTANQKVDFDCDVATAASLPAQIRPYNEDGTLYAVTTQPPESDITVQCTIMNVQREG